MNAENLKTIYQYALLLAAEEEWDQRDLGPIHLLKYAYLADLAYAKANNGATFTGLEWTFHHFGPWSPEGYRQVQEAADEIEAETITRQSDYETEWTRYAIREHPEELNREIRTFREKLPFEVRGIIENAVHRFKSDTKSLLFMVYATPPMLVAAPGELLDFQQAVKEPEAIYATRQNTVPSTLLDSLSNKKRKAADERAGKIREQMRERYNRKRARRTPSATAVGSEPDRNVIDWVESLAGAPFPSGPMRVDMDATLWKSPSRRGGEWSDDLSD